MMWPTRRTLIRSALGMLAAAFGVPGFGAGRPVEPGTDAQKVDAGVDLHIELHAVADQVAIRPGTPTRVWRYRGRLLRGDPQALDALEGTWLGPTIRVRRGQRVRIDLINELPESTIIHWHGLHVPAAMDGHPRYVIEPGARFVYEFTAVDRAGTYWYHPHPDARTGKQVYFGLVGLFLVSDDEEAALDLPRGAQDLPLVIQDRTFDGDNQFVYLSQRVDGATAGGSERGGMMMGGGMMGGGMAGGMMGRGGKGRGDMGQMMTGMMGVLGDEIVVNGRPDAHLEVQARPYRLRLLNGSNTRTYKLAWSDHSPLIAIGCDGGLLAEPLQRDYIMLTPAERVDLWVDFGRWPAGTELRLESLAFEGAMAMGMGGMAGGMMGGMMGGTALPDGAPFPVLTLRVNGTAAGSASLPRRLSSVPRPNPRVAVNFGRPKIFEITMGMMAWGINGKSFEMEAVSSLETVKMGTHEIWEFRNDASTMMRMAHAMHVHGLQFRVLGRTVDAGFARARDSVKAGYLDEGWKDTVLVMPGERVRILLHFTDYPGLFLYHCHMLEHEDTGLMRNYLVRA